MKNLLAITAVALSLSVHAQIPLPGEHRSFYEASIDVRDLSGHQSGSDGLVEISAEVVHQADGTLSGPFLAEYDDGFYYLSSTGEFTGSVAGTSKSKRATILYAGTIDFSESGTYSTKISGRWLPGDPNFYGRASSKVQLRELGIPPGTAHGDFRLRSYGAGLGIDFTNMVVTGTKLSGFARVQTGTPRLFGHTVTGSLGKKGYTLRLTGTDSGAGSSLVVKLDGNFAVIQQVSGKILGQTVKYKAP